MRLPVGEGTSLSEVWLEVFCTVSPATEIESGGLIVDEIDASFGLEIDTDREDPIMVDIVVDESEGKLIITPLDDELEVVVGDGPTLNEMIKVDEEPEAVTVDERVLTKTIEMDEEFSDNCATPPRLEDCVEV